MDIKRNGGSWTEARFNSFIKGGLRGISRRWPPKYQAIAEAYTGTKINTASGRMAKHYKCAECLGEFPAKMINADHIEAIIDPEVGFVDWDTVIERMFCEREGLQILCTSCHGIKTKAEREQAKLRKKDNK
jgi:hypothetical protein